MLATHASTLAYSINLPQVQGFFRSSELQPKSPFHISTAEKKLLILFFYYVFFQTIGSVHFSVVQQAGGTLQREVFSYFICEQNGHDSGSNDPCSRSGFENLINPGITLLSPLLTTIAPTVNFVFVIDYRELKQHVKDLCTRKSSSVKETEATSTTRKWLAICVLYYFYNHFFKLGNYIILPMHTFITVI